MFHCSRWPQRYAYARGISDRNYQETFYETRRSGHGGFGVRRPLRYLSYHLDLDEQQRRKVAACFERIKLEREQATLDRKKADAALADEFLRENVSVDDLRQALAPRTQVESNMQIVLAKELVEIATVLDSDQREEFAHLLRTGVLKL
jgi:hypothetical protein